MVVAGPGDEEYGADTEATDSGYVATAYGAGATDVLPEDYQQDGGPSTGLIVAALGAVLAVATIFGGE